MRGPRRYEVTSDNGSERFRHKDEAFEYAFATAKRHNGAAVFDEMANFGNVDLWEVDDQGNVSALRRKAIR